MHLYKVPMVLPDRVGKSLVRRCLITPGHDREGEIVMSNQRIGFAETVGPEEGANRSRKGLIAFLFVLAIAIAACGSVIASQQSSSTAPVEDETPSEDPSRQLQEPTSSAALIAADGGVEASPCVDLEEAPSYLEDLPGATAASTGLPLAHRGDSAQEIQTGIRRGIIADTTASIEGAIFWGQLDPSELLDQAAEDLDTELLATAFRNDSQLWQDACEEIVQYLDDNLANGSVDLKTSDDQSDFNYLVYGQAFEISGTTCAQPNPENEGTALFLIPTIDSDNSELVLFRQIAFERRTIVFEDCVGGADFDGVQELLDLRVVENANNQVETEDTDEEEGDIEVESVPNEDADDQTSTNVNNDEGASGEVDGSVTNNENADPIDGSVQPEPGEDDPVEAETIQNPNSDNQVDGNVNQNNQDDDEGDSDGGSNAADGVDPNVEGDQGVDADLPGPVGVDPAVTGPVGGDAGPGDGDGGGSDGNGNGSGAGGNTGPGEGAGNGNGASSDPGPAPYTVCVQLGDGVYSVVQSGFGPPPVDHKPLSGGVCESAPAPAPTPAPTPAPAPQPVVDVCSNISGAQSSAPAGTVVSGNSCVDACINAGGALVPIPEGQRRDGAGYCKAVQSSVFN